MHAKENLLRVIGGGRYVLAGVHSVAADTPASCRSALHGGVGDDAAALVGKPRWRQRE